jgi:hypothetical protein
MDLGAFYKMAGATEKSYVDQTLLPPRSKSTAQEIAHVGARETLICNETLFCRNLKGANGAGERKLKLNTIGTTKRFSTCQRGLSHLFHFREGYHRSIKCCSAAGPSVIDCMCSRWMYREPHSLPWRSKLLANSVRRTILLAYQSMLLVAPGEEHHLRTLP